VVSLFGSSSVCPVLLCSVAPLPLLLLLLNLGRARLLENSPPLPSSSPCCFPFGQRFKLEVVGGFGCEQRKTTEVKESGFRSRNPPSATCSAIVGHHRSLLLSLLHRLVRVRGFGVMGVSAHTSAASSPTIVVNHRLNLCLSLAGVTLGFQG